MSERRRALRIIAVIGLLSAAIFIALPWLGCVSNARVFGGTSPDDYFFWPRVCTLGFPFPESQRVYVYPTPALSGFTGPYWGNLIAGIAYLVAATYVAVSRRL